MKRKLINYITVFLLGFFTCLLIIILGGTVVGIDPFYGNPISLKELFTNNLSSIITMSAFIGAVAVYLYWDHNKPKK